MLPRLQSLSGLAQPPASVLILLRHSTTQQSCESRAELCGLAELGRAVMGSVGSSRHSFPHRTGCGAVALQGLCVLSRGVHRASQLGPSTVWWHPQLCWEGQGEGCAPGRAVRVISWHHGHLSIVAWQEAEGLVSLHDGSTVVAGSSTPQWAEMPKQNVFK